ncbi:MAG TPA: hypothetical protein VIM61_10910 [Chthoniobacterales bacterium]|jgi:Zn finger protein HypA/HybF involved in hydrogenase expression
MIPLTLGQVVVVYTAGLVTFLLFLSLGRTLFRMRREARSRRRQIQCAICGTIYENSTEVALPECPNCAHPNERRPPLGP